MPTDVCLWARRACGAEKRIADALLEFRGHNAHVTQRLPERQHDFMRTAMLAVLDVLRDTEDGRAWISQRHPMVVLSREHWAQSHLAEPSRNCMLVFRESATTDNDMGVIASWEYPKQESPSLVKYRVSIFPHVRKKNLFACEDPFGADRQCVEDHGELGLLSDGTSELLRAPDPVEIGLQINTYGNIYIIGQFFQHWLVRGEARATAEVLALSVFRALPEPVKAQIVRLVRDRFFSARVAKVAALNA